MQVNSKNNFVPDLYLERNQINASKLRSRTIYQFICK
jgi:hypothetical protein